MDQLARLTTALADRYTIERELGARMSVFVHHGIRPSSRAGNSYERYCNYE